MQRVLVLSDDKQLCKNIKAELEQAGFLVWVESNRHLEVKDVLRVAPELIVFDMPNWDEQKQAVYRMVSTEKCLEGLELAIFPLLSDKTLDVFNTRFKIDDFLLVPHRPLELIFRIKRVFVKKNKTYSQDGIKVRELTINASSYEVHLAGVLLDLTYKEYELLKYLATHRGRAFTRDELLNIVWGYDYYGGTRTVDVHIRRIRAKLGDEQEIYIKTVRGVGYLFREN